MRHIGFVGLGRMGKHMALNLLKSGAELTVAAPGPAASLPSSSAACGPPPTSSSSRDAKSFF